MVSCHPDTTACSVPPVSVSRHRPESGGHGTGAGHSGPLADVTCGFASRWVRVTRGPEARAVRRKWAGRPRDPARSQDDGPGRAARGVGRRVAGRRGPRREAGRLRGRRRAGARRQGPAAARLCGRCAAGRHRERRGLRDGARGAGRRRARCGRGCVSSLYLRRPRVTRPGWRVRRAAPRPGACGDGAVETRKAAGGAAAAAAKRLLDSPPPLPGTPAFDRAS